jgi:hypothetical protein
VADRKTGQEGEAGVDKQHSGSNNPSLLLEDLVRLLARSAALEAFEASQNKKDDGADDT